MKRWEHRLDIADVWKSELPWNEQRDAIVGRIRSSAWFVADALSGEDDLAFIVEDLASVDDVDDFDAVWDSFYDWCDDHRVWVNIHGPVKA